MEKDDEEFAKIELSKLVTAKVDILTAGNYNTVIFIFAVGGKDVWHVYLVHNINVEPLNQKATFVLLDKTEITFEFSQSYLINPEGISYFLNNEHAKIYYERYVKMMYNKFKKLYEEL
jgi:hypothetical protein